MTIAVGTYTGNGGYQRVTLGFRPEFVFVKGAPGGFAAIKLDGLWCGRANVLGATDSFPDGIAFADTGFAVGTAARVNTNGETYHYLAVAKSTDFALAHAGWQGNGAAGRVITLDHAITPAAVIVKRDSTRDAAILVTGSTCARMGGSTNAEAGAISGLSAGQFTVSGSVYTNEYDPALELGEGIDAIAFEAGDNIATTTYVGDGTTGRTVTLPFTPAAVIVQKVDGTARAGRVKLSTMSGSTTALVTDSALVSNEITIITNGIEFGASAGANDSGANYCVIAFRAHETRPPAAPFVKRSGRKAVSLTARGTTSWVDCGTDASLVLSGALTLEWMGAIEPVGRFNAASMMFRGSGHADAANECSFAFYANSWQGSPGNWSGPSLAVGCSDRLSLALTSTEIRSSWRTGLILPYGRFVHLVATHAGSGVWNVYRDGLIIRQRTIDLTAASLPNISGQAGHRMVLGAMRSSGAPSNMQRQSIMLARIYNRALSAAEVAARFARAGRQSTAEADVTSGLVEEWDAANASGSSMPATVAAANNGTITGGSVLAL